MTLLPFPLRPRPWLARGSLVFVLALATTAASAAPTAADAEAREARARETVGRLLALGLARPYSPKRADRHEIVCRKVQPSGSHIPKIHCGTNAVWTMHWTSAVPDIKELERKLATSAFSAPVTALLMQATARTQYRLRIEDRRLLEFGMGALSLADQFAGDEASQVGRLRWLLAEHRLAGLGMAAGAEMEETIRFSRAFMEIGRMARAGSPQDAELEAAIRHAGITVDAYNAMVDRLETDAQLRERVALVQMTYVLEF